MSAADCIFCKIATGEASAKIVFSDDICVAFDDLSPQAPTHVLIVPRAHITSLAEASDTDAPILGHLLVAASEIARRRGIADDGYRVVINTNADGGQTVFHLHIHLLGGRIFTFPPG